MGSLAGVELEMTAAGIVNYAADRDKANRRHCASDRAARRALDELEAAPVTRSLTLAQR